jgi:hypothetical protein
VPAGSLWANVAAFLNKQTGLDFKIGFYTGISGHRDDADL